MTHPVSNTATSTDLAAAHGSDALAQKKAKVLVYSDDSSTRATVRRAIGRRASRDTPFIEWVEVATADAMLAAVEDGDFDVVVLDGEAAKVGGFGLARQIKDTSYAPPALLLLMGRPQDAWLASWSQADAMIPYPLVPEDVADTVAALLRARA